MIRNQQTAEHYRWGSSDAWRLLDRPDLSVLQERMPPGAAEVKHLHRRARQLFYVVEGQVRIELAGEVLTLEAGDAVEVAPEQAHKVLNVSDKDVVLLVVSTPSTTGDREESEPLDMRR